MSWSSKIEDWISTSGTWDGSCKDIAKKVLPVWSQNGAVVQVIANKWDGIAGGEKIHKWSTVREFWTDFDGRKAIKHKGDWFGQRNLAKDNDRRGHLVTKGKKEAQAALWTPPQVTFWRVGTDWRFFTHLAGRKVGTSGSADICGWCHECDPDGQLCASGKLFQLWPDM